MNGGKEPLNTAQILELKGELDACHKSYERAMERIHQLQTEASDSKAAGEEKDERIAALNYSLQMLQADWNAQAPRLAAVRNFLAVIARISEDQHQHTQEEKEKTAN